ncbi:legumain-like isoform X1 [Acanthaster planci]|uniref:legumain n=1 Tax=Acanthaster planci TaxID=133434 RepID=A0A8B7ZKA1_ACAPL|nr:legumain-like isoform X1 [Acanthaster planci]
MKLFLALLLAPLVATFPSENFFPLPQAEPSPGKHWGLLVAGSNTWDNYRHQADICHAYQILHKNGIPDENIVVMMYDDIAYNEQNPTQGIIINRPNGPDVYHGVLKDYTKMEVNPKNFLHILSGNKTAMKGIGSGKVIASGPNDHVFVYFADHGATNLIAFREEVLYAKDLIRTLKKMHKENKYQKLVFYLEACESGSMFLKLPKNIDIYATTAAGPDTSSYACYFDEKLGTYLGDVYSVKWMEDSDKEDLTKETLEQQFMIVKKETNTSVVHQYGDLKFDQNTLINFQGNGGQQSVPGKPFPPSPLNAIDSRDVPLDILVRRFEATTNPVQKRMLMKEVAALADKQSFVHDLMYNLVIKMTKGDTMMTATVMNTRGRAVENWDCFTAAVQTFSDVCFKMTELPYAWGQMHVLANLCDLTNSQTSDITSALKIGCW